MMIRLVIVILCVISSAKVQAAAEDNPNSKDFYTAAVVEFRPAELTQPSAAILEEQLNEYLEIIRSTRSSEIDIIIFPEGTLNNLQQTTYVPNRDDKTIPCNDLSGRYADFLQKLSCVATEVGKYLVINLTEKEDCPAAGDDRPCANTGLNIYNTNVVFDRTGRVISRYRKQNLYLEAKNSTFNAEFGIFDTDFGVRFGHFICFDLLFYRPAEELVKQYRLRDLIVTSFFYSELPFLTGVQLQASWAWGNNVNLLAAGASFPKVGATGSGIYAGKNGTLTSFMAQTTGVRRWLVAKVPKNSNYTFHPSSTNDVLKSSMDSTNGNVQTTLKLLRDPDIEQFQSILLDGTAQQENYKLCHKEHCCSFEVDMSWMHSSTTTRRYRYRIGVFDGRRTYEKAVWSNIKVCALYSCLNESVQSCGQAIDLDKYSPPTFFINSINITGDFTNSPQVLIMPTSLNNDLYPVESEFVQWQQLEVGNHVTVRYSLRDYSNSLQTFGIYANYYDDSAAAPRFQIYWLVFTGIAGVLLAHRLLT